MVRFDLEFEAEIVPIYVQDNRNNEEKSQDSIHKCYTFFTVVSVAVIRHI